MTDERLSQHQPDSIQAALRNIAGLIPPNDPGWQHLLLQLNRATTFDSVKRGIVHDARNQLHTIMMSAHAVGDSPADAKLAEQLLPILVSASSRLEGVVQRLDETSTGPISQTVAPVSLKSAIDAAVAAIPTTRRIYNPPISVELSENLPAVIVSEDGLGHVLLNLLLNAREALAAQQAGEVQILVDEKDDHVRITFHDDGPGIGSNETASVLEPFFTTRADTGHLGLGLTVAASLLSSWGGEIEVVPAGESGGGHLVLSVRPAVH